MIVDAVIVVTLDGDHRVCRGLEVSASASNPFGEVCVFVLALLIALSIQTGQAAQSAIACTVTAGGLPVAGAEIVVAGNTHVTDRRGEVRIDVIPGSIEITVSMAWPPNRPW